MLYSTFFYRKGACENCGAMTHKKRDCLERPRKVGAKFSGSNFAPDERLMPNLSLTFDGKRDRWNGYDNFAHQEVFDEFKKLEEVSPPPITQSACSLSMNSSSCSKNLLSLCKHKVKY